MYCDDFSVVVECKDDGFNIIHNEKYKYNEDVYEDVFNERGQRTGNRKVGVQEVDRYIRIVEAFGSKQKALLEERVSKLIDVNVKYVKEGKSNG